MRLSNLVGVTQTPACPKPHLSPMPLPLRSVLPFCVLTLGLSLSALADEQIDPAPLPQSEIAPPGSADTAPTSAPEPNTAILAAIGGLALLFFSMRRK